MLFLSVFVIYFFSSLDLISKGFTSSLELQLEGFSSFLSRFEQVEHLSVHPIVFLLGLFQFLLVKLGTHIAVEQVAKSFVIFVAKLLLFGPELLPQRSGELRFQILKNYFAIVKISSKFFDESPDGDNKKDLANKN